MSAARLAAWILLANPSAPTNPKHVPVSLVLRAIFALKPHPALHVWFKISRPAITGPRLLNLLLRRRPPGGPPIGQIRRDIPLRNIIPDMDHHRTGNHLRADRLTDSRVQPRKTLSNSCAQWCTIRFAPKKLCNASRHPALLIGVHLAMIARPVCKATR